MSDFKYILEPYKGPRTRFVCPGCGKKEFSRYIDQNSGSYLADNVGRCNREDNCGYHYTPKEFFADNGALKSDRNKSDTWAHKSGSWTDAPEKPMSVIDSSIFRQSLSGYSGNTLISYLISLFGSEATGELIGQYFIGTSKYWPGATVFWQIDGFGRIRAGKIMLYHENGHRVKEPSNHVTWAHKVMNLEDFCLRQSLFGEHLIKGSTLPIAVVESEKTAVIASIYLPQFIWVSCGQKNGLSLEKCQALAGRSVVLFPDLGGYEAWSLKAKELERVLPGTCFAVSDLLERKATPEEKQKGLDLADYLVRFDYKELLNQSPRKSSNPMDSILDELIRVGNGDAMQLQNGNITPDEWGQRSDKLCDKIVAVGMPFRNYVNAVNHKFL